MPATTSAPPAMVVQRPTVKRSPPANHTPNAHGAALRSHDSVVLRPVLMGAARRRGDFAQQQPQRQGQGDQRPAAPGRMPSQTGGAVPGETAPEVRPPAPGPVTQGGDSLQPLRWKPVKSRSTKPAAGCGGTWRRISGRPSRFPRRACR